MHPPINPHVIQVRVALKNVDLCGIPIPKGTPGDSFYPRKSMEIHSLEILRGRCECMTPECLMLSLLTYDASAKAAFQTTFHATSDVQYDLIVAVVMNTIGLHYDEQYFPRPEVSTPPPSNIQISIHSQGPAHAIAC